MHRIYDEPEFKHNIAATTDAQTRCIHFYTSQTNILHPDIKI